MRAGETPAHIPGRMSLAAKLKWWLLPSIDPSECLQHGAGYTSDSFTQHPQAMNPLSRMLAPLGQAARAFFKADIALRRDEGGLQLVLEERSTVRPDSPMQAAARKERELLQLMRDELRAVLDELPSTRQTLRHLAHFERVLEKKGLKALRKLPLDMLRRSLEQFEGLVTNWTPVGLATLRSKMAVAVIERSQEPEPEGDDPTRTAAVMDAGSSMLPLYEELPEPAGDEDAALAAAYAALGHSAPSQAIELQGELGSRSARSLGKAAGATHGSSVQSDEIRLRELQP
jgi:hypothetical protein